MAETKQPTMEELMAKAKEMQNYMQNAQKEIMALQITGEAGGGMVKVIMNGAHQALKITISPTLMGEDEDMLEDLVLAAINDASKKIEETTKQKMMQMAKDMNLPQDMGGAGGANGSGMLN